jgi:outer membrane receptor for ferrienterochelin and colicin
VDSLMTFGSSTGFNNFKPMDWGRHWKVDTQAEYCVDDQTKWSFGVAHSSEQEGDYEFLGSFPRQDILTEYTRMFIRRDHQVDKDTRTYIQWFGNYWDSHCRALTDQTTHLQNDIEAQITFKPSDDHIISAGGNFRWDQMSMSNYSTLNEFIFDRDKYNEYWVGVFLVDRWAVTERLTLEGQFRLDNYSETTTDWSTRLTALYALDEQQNHVVRASFARAFRSPNVGLRRSSFSYLSGLFTNPATDTALDNEGMYSLEAGYTGRLAENLLLDIDTYYQRMERLIGYTLSTVGPITQTTFKNIDGADSYGAEISLTWRHKAGKITAWYAYNAFVTDKFGQVTRSIAPAMNKAGLTGRWYIDQDWTFNTNYAFQNSIYDYKTAAADTGNAGVSHRLDLTLSRKLADGKGEIMVGVTDVLNRTSGPIYDTGNFTALETPGRTIFARLQIQF